MVISPRVAMALDITPLSAEHRSAWAELLALAFDRQLEDMTRSLMWLLAAGPVIAYGAWDGERLAAQYACLVRHLHIPGHAAPVEVGMSLNMCVHPDYRGQGLVKHVSKPVYDTLKVRGAVAGMGFSNAEGVQVDRHSKGYGYQVVGKLASVLVVLPRTRAAPLDLYNIWSPEMIAPPSDTLHFVFSTAQLDHRYSAHPTNRYCFAVGEEGVVIYRKTMLRGMRGASLLAAYGHDLPALLRRWANTLHQQGILLAHLIATPGSQVWRSLRGISVGTVNLPYTRSPYYLTIKPLHDHTPDALFDFSRWDCTGGDIL
ncbi:MAG: hypothetical protein OHK0046_16220 [Anaerolineae bacterium]